MNWFRGKIPYISVVYYRSRNWTRHWKTGHPANVAPFYSYLILGVNFVYSHITLFHNSLHQKLSHFKWGSYFHTLLFKESQRIFHNLHHLEKKTQKKTDDCKSRLLFYRLRKYTYTPFPHCQEPFLSGFLLWPRHYECDFQKEKTLVTPRHTPPCQRHHCYGIRKWALYSAITFFTHK